MSNANCESAKYTLALKKPCGTCGKQGHHTRECAVYFKQICDAFPAWATSLVDHQQPTFMYIAQACIMLKQYYQQIAVHIWEVMLCHLKLPLDMKPQMLMERVREWEHICSVAQNLRIESYQDNRTHFLTKNGCKSLMNIICEQMNSMPEEDLHNSATWYVIAKVSCEIITHITKTSHEARSMITAVMVMPRCSKCSELGHRSNYCPKVDA